MLHSHPCPPPPWRLAAVPLLYLLLFIPPLLLHLLSVVTVGVLDLPRIRPTISSGSSSPSSSCYYSSSRADLARGDGLHCSVHYGHGILKPIMMVQTLVVVDCSLEIDQGGVRESQRS